MPLETRQRVKDFVEEYRRKKNSQSGANNKYAGIRAAQDLLEMDYQFHRRVHDKTVAFRKTLYPQAEVFTEEDTSSETEQIVCGP